MTTTTLSYRAINRKITSLHFPKINWKAVYLIGILFSLLMLVFYVYLINNLTKGTYLIKNYEKEIKLISQENNRLEISFADSSFLGEILDRAKELSFEKTKDIKYIQILENSLAKAK